MGKRKIPEILTEEKQQSSIDQFNERYPSSHRNKVMIQLMRGTGLRLAEACSLRWKDINLTNLIRVLQIRTLMQ